MELRWSGLAERLFPCYNPRIMDSGIFSEFALAVRKLAIDPSSSRMLDLVRAAKSKPISNADIVDLAVSLANSGARLPELGSEAADVPSTGGPSSLSTLLVPLYLRSLGRIVPKLSVPGRPAGGVDVLATIPDYNVHLTPSQVLGVLDTCSYAHFLSDKHFAPLDSALFTFRQRHGVQNVVPFVIASILSKKLAVGLKRIGLEVRVSTQGNFGTSFGEARQASSKFIAVARLLGIDATCFLTDGDRPYQPYIGRGEALVALDMLFKDQGSESLRRHARLCWAMALGLIRPDGKDSQPSGYNLRELFGDNLVAQGSNLEKFDQKVEEVRDASHIELISVKTGYVLVKPGIIKNVLVEAQRRDTSRADHGPPP